MEERARSALKAIILDALEEAEKPCKAKYKTHPWVLVTLAIETGLLIAALLIALEVS